MLAKRFNAITRERWVTVIDFLKLHYVLTERKDSDYWRDHCRAESIPESLADSLVLWRTQAPWLYESNRVELFSGASLQYVLYGMNFVTDIKDNLNRSWSKDAKIASRLFRENNMKTEQLFAALPTNRDLLNRVCRR